MALAICDSGYAAKEHMIRGAMSGASLVYTTHAGNLALEGHSSEMAAYASYVRLSLGLCCMYHCC